MSNSSPSKSSVSHNSWGLNESTEMDDSDCTMASVANYLEGLHANVSSPTEKESITSHLLNLSRERKDARILIGSHSQAMPLFISVLRSGTPIAKVNVAAILSVLCKEEDLWVKVLLGGCIPPLLSLLKSDSLEARKAAAEAIFEISSCGLSDDHVAMKIFVTEGVVPTLWDQLHPSVRQDNVVRAYVTGALRNLCRDKDGYWKTTLEAGGVEIILDLLFSDNPTAQSNAASLLARLMLAFSDSVPKVIDAGTVNALLLLLGREHDISVRSSAADALEALSSKSTRSKKALVESDGIPVLIDAVVAPSKECMQGECSQSLQNHAVGCLANICGGMSSLILYLGELCKSSRSVTPITDIIGALAYSLMIYESKSSEEPFNGTEIEDVLLNLLTIQSNRVIHERLFEALASLYGNTCISGSLNHVDAKRMLIGLITMASLDVQEHLIVSLTSLCSDGVDIWEALGKRDGIQLLISFLGLSSEQHQEYAVTLLSILTDQVDDSKWAITAAGGIPPLVQILETGSQNAREEAAHILWNLSCHSEDIRACVESAGAIPALLWLLRNGGSKGQEASSKALTRIIHYADSSTINQLLALLLGDSSTSKVHVITVLGHMLTLASHKDLISKGSLADKGLISLVQVLNSSNEENQEIAASVLADLFSARQDICDSLATDDIIHPCMKLLASKTQVIATQSARALSALSRPIKTKSMNKMSYMAEGDVKPLIKLAKSPSIDTSETAIAALANLISDPQIAGEALAEDLVSALTRVLGDGTPEGKMNASRALLHLFTHFPVNEVLKDNAKCRYTILALVDSLKEIKMENVGYPDALELISLLSRSKQNINTIFPPWSFLAEIPSSLGPIVKYLELEYPVAQDRAIEILSRLCHDQPIVLGEILVGKPRYIVSLAERIVSSTRLEVRIGAAMLLICATKECKKHCVEVLEVSGSLEKLICSLVSMMKHESRFIGLNTESSCPKSSIFMERNVYFNEDDEFNISDPTDNLEVTVSLWLLSIISSINEKSRCIFMEAGGLDILCQMLATYASTSLADLEDSEGLWIGSLLLSILFKDLTVCSSPVTMRLVPLLSSFLKSDDFIEKYFSAQALASLISNGSKAIHLAVVNSGAIGQLINLIGYIESEIPSLVMLAKEFDLVHSPELVILEHLFDIENIRVGATARKSIPSFVDLLRPMVDRPNAPSIAVRLLIKIAKGNDGNKIAMAEAGALDALTRYLSLSPHDSIETTITDLLGILFSNSELLRHEASLNSLSQLIAVLRLGSRNARLSAAKTLQELFNSECIRETEIARQAIQPLVDMLNFGTEREQQASLVALMKLTTGNSSRASLGIDIEGNTLESLYKILSSNSSLDIKTDAIKLCYVLFEDPKVRATQTASDCVKPLITLMESNIDSVVETSVRTFERLLEDEKQAELAAKFDVVDLLVGFISGSNYLLTEASVNCLIKIGKDRPNCKLGIVNAGVIENSLALLSVAPVSLCSSIAELLRILTNNSGIARSSTAAKIVEPLFLVLSRPDFNLWGQHSALQALVNILEKPQRLAMLKLTPRDVIEPLLVFLQSPSQDVQQLSTELLSYILAQEQFQQDLTTQNAVVPLVQLAGIKISNLQQAAIKSLESLSLAWPKSVYEARGVSELSKVITQDDPKPTHAMWESAALVLTNVLNSNSEYYFKVPLLVLVRMLRSTSECTVSTALTALVAQENNDASSAILMSEAGAIDALLDLLHTHRCEEASARLLETLLNNLKVREMKVSKYAIAPLSQYLLDPQSQSQSARLLVALALGDLFQHERLARSSASASACRALISLLEEQLTEEMTMVAICALQNLVMRSRTNRRAVAEAGGILVIQELLLSSNSEIAGQAVLLIKFLFSNHTLQEYVSNELIRSLTAALEKELGSTSMVSEEVLRTLYVIFTNFSKLHISEAATLCIPHLVGALKVGTEAAQEVVLDILCLLKHSWATMPIDIATSQAMTAAEAIPILQQLMKVCPPGFHDRADSLLHCLPGCLRVTIKRGNNLKQPMGSTNAFCQLTIGNGPPRHTKVINHSTSPVWEEGFTWVFDVPPKGQKLHILCKSKNTFGKTTLGRVTIQIDKVVADGVFSGFFRLNHDNNKDKDVSSRTLEIEIIWSNRSSTEIS